MLSKVRKVGMLQNLGPCDHSHEPKLGGGGIPFQEFKGGLKISGKIAFFN